MKSVQPHKHLEWSAAGGAARRPACGARRGAGGLNTTEVREWAKGVQLPDGRSWPGLRTQTV
jgi:hypothetical protein